MMRTNVLRIARRHGLEGSSRSSSVIVRTITTSTSRTDTRNLSSVVAVRSNPEHQDSSTPGHQKIRTDVNGTIKLSSKKRAAKSSATKHGQRRARVATTSKEKEQIEKSDVRDNYINQEHTDGEAHVSPAHLMYTGGTTMPLTSHLKIIEPGHDLPIGIWPVFRIMDEDGCFRCPSNDGYVDPERDTSAGSSRKESTTISPPPDDNASSTSKHDLASLRSLLSSKYPFHASEVLDNVLLQSSAHDFADTGSDNTLLRAQRQMIRLRQMDNILQNAQRQGRISFYMTCRGEEAIHIGSASALKQQDVILAQYREHGLLMWRGFTLEQFTNQCFSNDLDLGRGRQMPVHYGSRALNYHTISSPLGTQIPQATGVGYKLKLDAAKMEDPSEAGIAICYFGDGCASTTDFHAGLNFAATLKAPVVFFCRNNGYAISTSVEDQYAGDGIVCRAPGYGMAGLRVDGNDAFAVSAAVRKAREYCLTNNAPILIEAITYRQGHHSTSDDSSRYRCPKEVHDHSTSTDPVKRLNKFLHRHGWVSSDDTAKIRDEERMAVLNAMEAAERRPPPKLDTLFADVYEEMPLHLRRQEQQLQQHLAKYPGRY